MVGVGRTEPPAMRVHSRAAIVDTPYHVTRSAFHSSRVAVYGAVLIARFAHLLPLVALGLACGPAAPAKPEGKVIAPAKPAPVVTPASDTSKPASEPARATPAREVKPLDAETGARVAESINAFAVDLHHALADQPGNLFVSPASIAVAFAMTHAGARGETEQQIARVFHFGDDAAKTREGFAAALAGWAVPQENLELTVANRLFGEKTATFEPAFIDLTRTVFGAPLELTDFKGAPDPARDHINSWVAAHTHDRITNLVPVGGINATTRLVLVNAVYFKAGWREPFSEAQTKNGAFHVASGKKTVELMTRTDEYPANVVASAKLKLVELPYQSTFSLVVVLPDAKDGLAAVEKAMTAEALRGWISGLRSQRVAVKLPSFKIEPTEGLRLAGILAGLGMPAAFDAQAADFTGMAPKSEQIVLSEAVHKAFVAVDEKGTEAAAATAVAARAGGMPPSGEPLDFTVDHPFLFLIRDTNTGAILFMGRFTDPQP